VNHRFWLVMKTADGKERPFPIRLPRTVIGRGVRSDVRVPVPTVAPQHCEIVVCNDRLKLTDLGSAHGTCHNGNRVDEAFLANADRVTVGPVTFEIRDDHAPLPRRKPDPGRGAAGRNGRPIAGVD
jgi:hypothetical protein